MKKNQSVIGGFLIIIAAIIWGIDGVLLTPAYFTKFQFYDVNFIVFIAHAIPTLILSVLFRSQYKELKSFTKNDIIFFLLVALFGGTLGTLSIVKALQLSEFSKFSIVILIQKTQPIFAILLAFILLKERPSKKFYIVAGISLAAIYVLTFEFKSPALLPKNNILASLYSLLAAFSFGSATVFGKKIVNKFSFLTSTFYRFFFTAVITLFFVIFSGNAESSISQYGTNIGLVSLSIAISVLGLLAILIYYNGLKSVKASVSAFCELAFPLTSIVIEAAVLKHFLSPVQVAAAIVLIFSVLYLNLGKANVDIKEIDKFQETDEI